MAIMLPNKPIKNNSFAEEKLFSKLRDKLSDEWLVIHSYNWSRDTSGNESDFVVFNKSYGVIIFEVKGGGVYCVERDWYTIDKNGTRISIRNPYEQADHGAANLYKELKGYLAKNSDLTEVKVYNGVCLPDVEENSFQTDNISIINRTLFKNSLYDGSLEERILYIIEEHKESNPIRYNTAKAISDETAKIIRKFFDYYVKSMISNEYTWLEASDVFIKLSKDQEKIIDNLKYNDKVTITGPSGTGKTIIALAKAKQDYILGKNVLFLYFNHKIKEEIKKEVDLIKDANLTNSIDVCTIGELFYRYINKGQDISYAEAALNFINTGIYDKWDTIIIDEAQDFKKEVINKIKNLDYKQIYIFYDRYQRLNKFINYDVDYLNLGLNYSLNKNLRSSNEIVSTSYSLVGIEDIESYHNNVKGKKPLLITLKEHSALDKSLECIDNQLKESIREEILILTTSTIEKSKIIKFRCSGNKLCTRQKNYLYQLINKGLAESKLLKLSDADSVKNENNVIVNPINSYDYCKDCIQKNIYTIREAKGVEVKSVFIFDEDNILYDLVNNDDLSNRLLYTAITRSNFKVIIISQYITSINYTDLVNRFNLNYLSFNTINEAINDINSYI